MEVMNKSEIIKEEIENYFSENNGYLKDVLDEASDVFLFEATNVIDSLPEFQKRLVFVYEQNGGDKKDLANIVVEKLMEEDKYLMEVNFDVFVNEG